MKKFIVLILGLSLTAASCNVLDVFDISSGARGVFRSQDAAASFHTANKIRPSGDLGDVSVNALVFDSKNPNILYLGSGSGIYKSVDGGGSWKYILTGIAVADLAIDTDQLGVIYAVGLASAHGKIIKSSDAGVSWVDMYTEPSQSNAVETVDVTSMGSKIILAGLHSGEIIRSTDGGGTWQAVKDVTDRVVKIRFASNGNAYALTLAKGLFKSTDRGITWALLTSVLTTSNFLSSQNTTPTVSAFHDLGIDERQSGVLYLGTHQGLFRSVNDGSDWSFLALPVINSSIKVSAVAINPQNPNNLYVGIGSTLFKSLNGGLTWETRNLNTNQEVRLILVDPQSQNVVYLGLGDKK